MFFKAAVFKKLIKEAYAGIGLTIGRAEEYIFLSGGYWLIWMKKDKIPNKLKASIIELTGELPINNQVFKARKGEKNDYSTDWKETYNINFYKRSMDQEYVVTKVILEQNLTPCRLLQNEETQEIILLNQVLIDLVDKEAIESREECQPFGPIGLKDKKDAVLWYNDTGALVAWRRTPEAETRQQMLIEALEKIEVESWVG